MIVLKWRKFLSQIIVDWRIKWKEALEEDAKRWAIKYYERSMHEDEEHGPYEEWNDDHLESLKKLGKKN